MAGMQAAGGFVEGMWRFMFILIAMLMQMHYKQIMVVIGRILKKLILKEEQDKISDLPDSVLTEMLSRLSTKEAVSTSILSKNWKTKWTCIQDLDFNYSSRKSGLTGARPEKFASFVQRVLNHCGKFRIRTFSLVCHKCYNSTQVTRWISTTLKAGVEVFTLDYPTGDFSFPSVFLGLESLVIAKVNIPWTLEVSPFTSFKNLKSLSLTRMKLANKNFPDSKDLFFSFPALHTFIMQRCMWLGVGLIKIEAPNLSIFQVSRCKYYGDGNQSCEIYILGGAKNLSFVKWTTEDFFENFILPNPPKVDLAALNHFLEIQDIWIAGVGAAKFIHQLVFSVTRLELSIDIVEAMEISGTMHYIRRLDQVTHLRLGTKHSGSTRALMNLLRKTPNLQNLEIISAFAWKNDDVELIGTLPFCVMCRLRNVYMRYDFMEAIGFRLIRLLLQNGHVLKLMSVSIPKLSAWVKTDIWMNLIMKPRASPYVRIQVQ